MCLRADLTGFGGGVERSDLRDEAVASPFGVFFTHA
jgi:hypothetical protein